MMSGEGDLIGTDGLPGEQQRVLRVLAESMIPASDEYQLPGADDAEIFADILAAVKPLRSVVTEALQALDDLSSATFDSPFTALDAESRLKTVASLQRSQPGLVGVLVRLVVQSYYRDDRVMQSLNMEPRPPHPDGFVVEEGDWSLLEPVRQRERLFREVP